MRIGGHARGNYECRPSRSSVRVLSGPGGDGSANHLSRTRRVADHSARRLYQICDLHEHQRRGRRLRRTAVMAPASSQPELDRLSTYRALGAPTASRRVMLAAIIRFRLAGQHAAQLLVVVRVVILLWTRRSRDVVLRWSWLVQQDGCHCYFSYVFFRMFVRPQRWLLSRRCSGRSFEPDPCTRSTR